MIAATGIRSQQSVMTFLGTVGVTYRIPLRVRAVVGLKTYAGGTPVQPYVLDGGTPAGDDADHVRLSISAPSKTYHLNVGKSDVPAGCVALDYLLFVSVAHGATITLWHDNIDFHQYKGDSEGNLLTAGGLKVINGANWVQVDFDSLNEMVDYSVRLGGGTREWVWTAFAENVYGIRSEK